MVCPAMNYDSSNREHWDQVAEHWRESRPDGPWRLHADRINADLLDRWLPSNRIGRLLKTDLFDEAATGGLSDLLQGRAQLVVGIDLSRVTAGVAQSRANGIMVACADVRALPFADETFDVIVSNSTLDHFRSRKELIASMRELNRVTRPGGELVLTLDNRANPVVALRNALPFHWLNHIRVLPYYVGVTCGPRGLRKLLAETNWDLREMDAILHCPRFLVIQLSQILVRRAGIKTQKQFFTRLARFERLARWPTRYLTGYFVAAHAVRGRKGTNEVL
jgi:SAM-dependent methyltransferase